MTPTIQKTAVTAVQSLLFGFFIFLSSCSTDSIEDIIDNKEMEIPISTDDAVLADDFILDATNRVVNYILPKSEYDKYLNDEGDFSLVSKKNIRTL